MIVIKSVVAIKTYDYFTLVVTFYFLLRLKTAGVKDACYGYAKPRNVSLPNVKEISGFELKIINYKTIISLLIYNFTVFFDF